MGPGSAVALRLPTGPAYVALIHAALRLGAIIVPLNNRLTPAELMPQLRLISPALLLSDAPLPGATAPDSLPDAPPLMGAAPAPLDAPLAVVFTSGTSGGPKGVLLTRANFLYAAMSSAYRLGTLPEDRWLCVLPPYHVGGLSIFLRAALYGIAVDLHPRFDLDAVNAGLADATLVSLVPTMLHRLLGVRDEWPRALRLILLGGAAAPPDLLMGCFARGLPVAPTYGMTEAASQVATMLPADAARKPGSVGRPLLFNAVAVVDQAGRAVAPGEYGEIVVRGPTVMDGYYRNAEATARALRNGALYTGDIGYLDAEGDLWVVQRRSDLIISGGENIYPAEVEAALRAHPAVAEACVVGVPHREWGQQVAAALVLRASVAPEVILDALRGSLAGYKLPRRVRVVDALPQTASGKIERRAVAALFDEEDA